MTLTIVHYTVLVAVLVILFVLQTRKAAQSKPQAATSSKATPRALTPTDAIPDEPVPFGYKCTWLAVKTTDGENVAREVGLKLLGPCNWESGIAAAYYQGGIFVSPAIGGWTLVVGQDLPSLDEESRKKQTEALLAKLSQRFGEAQHFGTHRVSEFHAWAKAVDGKILREFAYLAGDEKLCDVGTMTDEERDAGITDSPDLFVTENHVMKVAERWSLDPCKLTSSSAQKGVGWLGTL